jgi:transposase
MEPELDLFGCRMTPGTIAKTTLTLAQIIEPVVAEMACQVKAAAVKHLDETGLRIGGKTNWLHVVATETQTWYRVSPLRKDIEVLADIKGVVE